MGLGSVEGEETKQQTEPAAEETIKKEDATEEKEEDAVCHEMGHTRK